MDLFNFNDRRKNNQDERKLQQNIELKNLNNLIGNGVID